MDATGPQQPTVPAPGHKAYSQLVENDEDLVGLIAYSLYKSDKLAFLGQHQSDLGRPPTHDEVMAFCRTSTLPGPVSAYRTKATHLLQQMYEELLDEQVQELEGQYKAKLVAELKHAHPFWASVWQHMLAGLMVWAIVGFVILVLYGHKVGYKELARDILGLNSPTAVSVPAPN